LLEAALREEGGRGKLKIFLGAAPGVGKTTRFSSDQPASAPTADADDDRHPVKPRCAGCGVLEHRVGLADAGAAPRKI